MDLTNEDVADILALLDSLPYDALDVQTPRFRLTLRRAPGGGWTEESQVLAEPAPAAAAPPNGASAPSLVTPDVRGTPGAARGGDTAVTGQETATGSAGTGAAGVGFTGGGEPDRSAATGGAGAPGADAADTDGLIAVAAPLPGTFYRAPRPGAAPFVEAGDAVTADTVVAIVETMKLMNSVHAGTAGRVARIALENGEFAPLGTTLMLIEPSP